MNVGELKQVLEKFDDGMDVMIMLRPSLGNIQEVFSYYPSTYSLMGVVEPCLMLDNQGHIESVDELSIGDNVYAFELNVRGKVTLFLDGQFVEITADDGSKYQVEASPDLLTAAC